ncbi:MAG TPA: hypothetical protein ENI96_12550 [Sedimenticola thiotaurini]|uniref:Uncharacterized protein n=1 Tax=Sedimenticola thiotaurini TaxID=1543721 RepID=A0A831RPD0_9GAMM|nr:hypothetical protein [Sedimenticola thiotaurini]
MEREPGQIDHVSTDGAQLGRLLSSLQKLMLQLRARIWQQRLQSVELHRHTARVQDADLHAVIERYIRICAGRGNGTTDACRPSATQGTGTAPSTRNGAPLPGAARPLQESELSRYLHQASHEGSHSSPLVEHFRSSIWDHIHAAIRATREGETAKSKLHAELANNALGEAARYMDEETFSRFMDELHQSLQRLADHHQGPDRA